MANPKPKNNQRPDRASNRKAGNVAELTPEELTQQLAKELRIRPKTKALYDEIINDPKITQREAYLKTHKTTNIRTADNQASKLLNSHKYSIYKASAVGKAKRKVVALVDSRNESIALKASESIIDRVEGKAVTRQEISQKTITVKLDLQGTKLGAHYVAPEQSPTI